MIASERHLFDIPAGVAYFNSAYNSPQLNATREALLEAARAKSHPWERLPADFFANADTMRSLAAEVFGGDPDGFAVIPASSYGVSTAARAVEPLLKSGDEILIWSEEFPATTSHGAVSQTRRAQGSSLQIYPLVRTGPLRF